MQFLPLTQPELESTLLVLNRALEHDQLSEVERNSIRSVLQKVGAGKVIEESRHRGDSDPFQLLQEPALWGSDRPAGLKAR